MQPRNKPIINCVNLEPNADLMDDPTRLLQYGQTEADTEIRSLQYPHRIFPPLASGDFTKKYRPQISGNPIIRKNRIISPVADGAVKNCIIFTSYYFISIGLKQGPGICASAPGQ